MNFIFRRASEMIHLYVIDKNTFYFFNIISNTFYFIFVSDILFLLMSSILITENADCVVSKNTKFKIKMKYVGTKKM